MSVTFLGGDDWQRTLQIESGQWEGACRVEARLAYQGLPLKTTRLRLASVDALNSLDTTRLEANGKLLQIDKAPLTLVVRRSGAGGGPPRSEASLAEAATAGAGAPALVFTADVYATAEPGQTLIQAAGATLGLAERLSAYQRRGAAEWVVAAIHAARQQRFERVDIIVTRDFLDIGLNLTDADLFLRGMIQILQSNPRWEIGLDVSALQAGAASRRDRALLVRCLEAKSLLD